DAPAPTPPGARPPVRTSNVKSRSAAGSGAGLLVGSILAVGFLVVLGGGFLVWLLWAQAAPRTPASGEPVRLAEAIAHLPHEDSAPAPVIEPVQAESPAAREPQEKTAKAQP